MGPSQKMGVLLWIGLLSTSCASLTPPPGRAMSLRYTHGETAAPVWAGSSGEESAPESEWPRMQHRHQGTREAMTTVDSGGAEDTGSALAAHLAFLGAAGEVSAS